MVLYGAHQLYVTHLPPAPVSPSTFNYGDRPHAAVFFFFFFSFPIVRRRFSPTLRITFCRDWWVGGVPYYWRARLLVHALSQRCLVGLLSFGPTRMPSLSTMAPENSMGGWSGCIRQAEAGSGPKTFGPGQICAENPPEMLQETFGQLANILPLVFQDPFRLPLSRPISQARWAQGAGCGTGVGHPCKSICLPHREHRFNPHGKCACPCLPSSHHGYHPPGDGRPQPPLGHLLQRESDVQGPRRSVGGSLPYYVVMHLVPSSCHDSIILLSS